MSHLITKPLKAVFASYLIRFKPFIDKQFLAYFLQSPNYWAAIADEKLGIAVPNVNATKLKSITLPIPPAAEQRRIVAKIEQLFSELDRGVESLKTTRAKLYVYRQAALKHAFEGKLTARWREDNRDRLEIPEQLFARIKQERETRYKGALDDYHKAIGDWREGREKGRKPATPKQPHGFALLEHHERDKLPLLPPEWTFSRMGLYIDQIEAGKSFKCLEIEPSANQVGVAKVSAVSWGEYDETESKTCLDADKIDEDLFIREGDFLMSRANTIELVGAAVIAKTVTKRIMLSDKTLRIHFTPGPVNRRFFLYYLRSLHGRNEIETRSTGNQESMRNIGQDRIRNIILPVCTEFEQAEIVRILDARLGAAKAVQAEIDAALTRTDALRQSILKKAFSGQLIPQDPHDEPASILLDRIKAKKENLAKKDLSAKTKKKKPTA